MTETAPFFDKIAEGPEGGSAVWLTTSDGLRIRVAHWADASAKGTVLLFPGRTEYIEKYGRDAALLREAGFATVTIDWRGQGLADRMTENVALGHVQSFEDYQHDVRAMLAYVREIGLPEPYFLVAHSMGGCIGLRALHEGLPVKAAAFSAPMWGIKMSAALRPIAWGIARLSVPLGFSHSLAPGQQENTYVMRAEFDENTLTSDEGMFNYMRDQVVAHPELALGGPTLNWLNEALSEMLLLRRREQPAIPTEVFLGTNERIVDPCAIHDVVSKWPSAHLNVIPDGRHEILMETPAVRAQVFKQIAAHFHKHCQCETA